MYVYSLINIHMYFPIFILQLNLSEYV